MFKLLSRVIFNKLIINNKTININILYEKKKEYKKL